MLFLYKETFNLIEQVAFLTPEKLFILRKEEILDM